MYKRIVPAVLLAAYAALLIKIMVLKDMPLVKVGQIMLNFGGTDAGHGPNFVPFATIVPYLMGHKGLVIAGINIVGNIALLVPLGFLAPLVYRAMTWQKAFVLSVVSGSVIEVMQVVMRVGIFDIDDVLLNALGFMLGYWAYLLVGKFARSTFAKVSVIALGVSAVAVVVLAFDIRLGPAVRHGAADTTVQGTDLCGGTGGNGYIVSIGDDSFVLRRNDDKDQRVILIPQAAINTPVGPGSLSDLNAGDRVTLVGGPNPDGSFTAEAVFVCGAPSTDSTPSLRPAFEWRYTPSMRGDIPYSTIALVARYPDGFVKTKDIDTIAGGCNEYEPADTDVYEKSSMIICYYAGLGHYYKVVESDGHYLVKRKVFEEASPEYAPPPEEFKTIVRF